jgi:hypothetical protein
VKTEGNKNRREMKEDRKEENWLEARRDEIFNMVATAREEKIHIDIHDVVSLTPTYPRHCSV